jgi:hypothetical protein
MTPGQKIHEQIDEAIRLHDKLLLLLSSHSMSSEWVKTEIAKARKRELNENRRMLFPPQPRPLPNPPSLGIPRLRLRPRLRPRAKGTAARRQTR